MPRHESEDSRKSRPAIAHEFSPGRAVQGVAALTATLLYAGDAGDLWQIPWFVVLPVVFGGLALAGAVTFAHQDVRRRRAATRAPSEGPESPASTSGGQAVP
ncbi:hypothetical protein [Streptomyces sp. NPDC020965]|uniref:hypothetical protein n=1 Tax=Streptomyces sp. NPDC020965 TaxID=3365105 RepID=UPI0037BCF2A8